MGIEGVIIALPLHLHAPVAIEAMLKGKHVLTEKLMAHNVAQCKWLGRVSEATQRYCATGHQRHYSILYDNAVNLIVGACLAKSTTFGPSGTAATWSKSGRKRMKKK